MGHPKLGLPSKYEGKGIWVYYRLLLLLLPRLFLLHAGSPFLISLFQCVWSVASVVLKFYSNISSSMQSIHLLVSLPGYLLPGISILTLVLSHGPTLFARHVHTTLVFSPVSFHYLCNLHSLLNLFISDFIPPCDSLHPPQHFHFCYIHSPLM